MTATRDRSAGSGGSARDELFGPDRRATIGLVLLVSLVAFEAMGVGTAMRRWSPISR